MRQSLMTYTRRDVGRIAVATLAGARLLDGQSYAQTASIGVGARPEPGAEVIIDGSRAMLDEKWTYWEGPRFKSSLPIKWKIVEDPVDKGTVVQTDDPAAAGGKYGAADIVTKKTYRDFRLHIEFLVMKPGGNSGVYLQNRYEIQVLDGDKTKHGMGAVINETESPYQPYNGVGKWNAYDIVFRAARFKDGKRVEKAMVSMYFNGKKVHTNVPINQVWGGPNSGIDGGNEKGQRHHRRPRPAQAPGRRPRRALPQRLDSQDRPGQGRHELLIRPPASVSAAQCSTRPADAFQRTRSFARRAALAICAVSAAACPTRMSAFGVRRLRMQSSQFCRCAIEPSPLDRTKISGSGVCDPGAYAASSRYTASRARSILSVARSPRSSSPPSSTRLT